MTEGSVATPHNPPQAVISHVEGQAVIIGDNAQMTITHGPRYELSGDFRGALLNIESTLRDVRQSIEALPAPDDARAALIRLINRLDRALRATPPDRAAEAQEVAGLAKELLTAAGAPKPRPSVIRALGDELGQAAASLADAVPDAPAITAQIAAAAGLPNPT